MSNKVVGAAGTTVPVDISKLSQGLATTFRGVTEVFEAIGAETAPGFGTVTPSEPAETEKPKKAKAKEAPAEESVKEPEQASEHASAPAEETKPEESKVTGEKPEEGGGKASAEPEQPAEAKEEKKPSMTVDDLIKVAAQKVKAKKENSDKIGALVKSYGVDSLHDLPPAKFEDFFTDLTQI